LINVLKETYALDQLLATLEVSKSGLHAHRHKAQTARRQQDEQLIKMMKALFEQSRYTYGSPRLCAALRAQGERIGKNRIARLMRQSGLRPKQKRRFRPQTTLSKHNLPLTQNWLAKVPAPERPNQVWLADITYIPTAQGWLYLAVELDACSRKIAGWSTRADLSTTLVLEAWRRAIERYPLAPGLLHHSDRGCQYASSDFQSLLQKFKACGSMSRRANPYDNAMMESFFATLKTECFDQSLPPTHAAARLMLFDYIEGFYNTHRRHSSLGDRSPLEFEQSIS
jgi:transposase InsO family protein